MAAAGVIALVVAYVPINLSANVVLAPLGLAIGAAGWTAVTVAFGREAALI